MQQQEDNLDEKLKEITDSIMRDDLNLAEASRLVRRATAIFFGEEPLRPRKIRRGVGS